MKKIIAVALAAAMGLAVTSPASAWYAGGGYWGGGYYGGGYGYGGAGLGIALGAGLLGGIIGGAIAGGGGGYCPGCYGGGYGQYRGYAPTGAAPGTWGPAYSYGPPTVVQRNYGGYYGGYGW